MHMLITRGLVPLTAAAALVAGCGSDDSASSSSTPAATGGGSGTISVKLNEWAVEPSADSAKAGTVTFDVANDGKLPHELVVLKTDKAAGSLGSGAEVPEPGNQGEVEDIGPGESKTLTLDLAAGHYVLICNISGHYSSGMRTDFTVS
jgi:uncharacterized cupredoxin-like copper-binding protein